MSLRTLLVLALLVGCGGSKPAETPSGPTGEAEPLGDRKFDDLPPGKKGEYMKAVVLPQMTKVLQQSPEPEHFTNVTCATCHGPSAKQGNFEMPTASLPKLGAFEAEMEAHPKMTRYMAEVVVPEMARLLNEAPFDPGTGQGFGCFGCHMKKE
ncbi:MAG: hypothetical protein DIU78_001025 [Pseudomonadota bacterium]